MSDDTKFQILQLTEYTPESIIDELKRVSKIIPENECVTIERFKAHARVDHTTVKRRFGTWENALRVAGLASRFSGREGKRNPIRSRTMTDDDIIDRLRQLGAQLGRDVISIADIEAQTDIGRKLLVSRWGSVQNAISAAGLQNSKAGARYSDQECYQNLFTVWSHYGRPPRHREMNEFPSKIGPKAYVLRFGSWRMSLAAFLNWIECSNAQINQSHLENHGKLYEITDLPRPARRGPRDVSWGLRFKVLSRDRFKCVLCGDHPAVNPMCKLHVDHILPWSRGGETVFENLRSLCEVCNVGRGNRFEE